MPRFFVQPEAVGDGVIQLDDADLRHIRVLRLGAEEQFTVCDGSGRDFLCRMGGDGVAEILGEHPSRGEPDLRCRVFAGFAKGERADLAVQKSVELGAAEICLFPAERSIARYDGKSLAKKLERWNKIALEAAKQSGRGMVPRVTAAGSFREAVALAGGADLPLFFYEDEDRLSLRAALDGAGTFGTASIVTGPEGGFTPEEVDLARGAGLRVVTLGPRILRCETAPAAALAAIMFYSGNL